MTKVKNNLNRVKGVSIALCLVMLTSCARVEKISQTELQQAVTERKELHDQKRGEAIVNFHNLSFRKKLDADIRKPSDWWTPLEIGESVLVLSQVVKDSAGVEYLEIQRTNPTQDTGYARAAFIAEGARLAVVKGKEAFRYSRQSLTRLTKDTVPFMTLIAVYLDTAYEGLVQFDYNNENGVVYKDQYIEESQISYADSDIDTAKFIFLAKITKDKILKSRFLQKAQEFNSTVFGTVADDFLAVLKDDFAILLKEGQIKEIKPAIKVLPGQNITYRTQAGLQGVVLGVLPENQEVTLTYETLLRSTLDGKTASWYFAPGYGWVFGADVEIGVDNQKNAKDDQNKEKRQK